MSKYNVKDVTYSPIEPVESEVQGFLVITSDSGAMFQRCCLPMPSNPSKREKGSKSERDTSREK